MIEQALIEYLANAFWQVPLLVAGAWLLLRVVKPGPAAQYRVWLGILGIALLLPLHGSLYGVPQVDAVRAQPVAAEQTAISSGAVGSISAAESIGEPGGLVLGRELTGDGPSFSWMMFPARVRRVRLNAVAVHWIVGMYMALVLFGLFRIARSWHMARHLVEDSREAGLSDRERAALADCSRRFGVSLPQVRESLEISGPVVVGAVAPVLLWPENFANHSEDEVMAALCHEMAHIRRHDYLVNLLCEAAALPLTWHPVIYGVQRRIRGTREMVCDSMAADAMQSEMAYAKCLLSLAQSMVSGSGLAERAQVPGLLSGNVLEERVMRLMQGKTAMSVRAKVARGAVGAAAMVVPIALAAMFHVAPTMAQSDAAQKVTGGVPGVVVDGVQGGMQQGARDGVPDGVVAPDVKVSPAAPEVKVRPISPVVKVSPVVTVVPLEKLAMVSPVVDVTPMVKVLPVVTVTPVVKVKPLGELMTVSPVIHVTPEIKMLPEVQAAPEPQEKPNGAASGASGSGAGAGSGHGTGSGTGSGTGQGTGHRMYAVVDGQERELTPEEQRRVEQQLDTAQKQIAAAIARLNSPEFKAQMEKSQRDAEEAMRKLNSGEFQKQMADAQKRVAEATARLNSPEFKKQMEEAAQAASKIDSAEMQKQMAEAQKQVAEATAKINSPEFKKQMEEAAQAASKIDSAEIQKQMAEAQKQIADAMARVKAEQGNAPKP